MILWRGVGSWVRVDSDLLVVLEEDEETLETATWVYEKWEDFRRICEMVFSTIASIFERSVGEFGSMEVLEFFNKGFWELRRFKLCCKLFWDGQSSFENIFSKNVWS